MTASFITSVANDPREFRQRLLVDTDAGPRPFDTVMDPWQRDDFSALDNGWRNVAGIPTDNSAKQFSRAYLERGRGHSKTTDIAVSTIWALIAGKRKLSGVCAAADRDQAGLLPDAVDKLCRLNPWLGQLIDVQRERIINTHTGSELVILSSDVASSYGLTPDFVVCDELTHWPRRELWDSLLSSAAKRERCMLLVISNAGLINSWQWQIREAVRTDPDWHFSRLDGPVASWISAIRLHEQRRLLPGKAYRRLWQNEWVADTGDAIDETDLEDSTVFDEPITEFDQRCAPYIGSLDLAVRRDGCGFVVFALNLRGERPRVAYCKSWLASDYGGRIPLEEVRKEVVRAAEVYRLGGVVYDPKEGEYLAERLGSEHGIPMYRYPWTSKTHTECALALISAFRDRQIDLYRHAELLRDLRKVSIIERSNRWSLILPRDEFGHCDLAASFVQGLVWALGTRRDFEFTQ